LLYLTTEEIIDKVANFLIDPTEYEYTKDQFRVLFIKEGILFREFYREFYLLASLAQKTNIDKLYNNLAYKITLVYRYTNTTVFLNYKSIAEDIHIYHYIDIIEARIRTIYSTYYSYDNSTFRKKQDATYLSSKQELI
jgi:hypothetical protein